MESLSRLPAFYENLSSREKVALGAAVASGILFSVWWKRSKKLVINFDGFVAPGFEKVAQAFKQNLESKTERGGSFAVYYKGVLVADLWGGYADEGSLRLWNRESTSLAFSATKGITAVCMAHLVERGLLDYKMPISHYWPEFAQNGKENITVEMLLSHKAGIYAITGGFSVSMIRDDNEKLSQLLAKQKPFWEPGTKHGYHAVTFGLYSDQIVRRVDPKRRTLWQYYEEEIAIPFGIEFDIEEKKENFYKACRHGAANFGWLYTFTTTIPVTIKYCFTLLWYYVRNRRLYVSDLFGNVTDWDPRKFNDPYSRSIPNGASSGVSTARGLAKFYGILANAGLMPDQSSDVTVSVKSIDIDRLKCSGRYVDGKRDEKLSKRLLKAETIELLFEPQTGPRDEVLVADLKFARGLMVFQSKYQNKKISQFGHWGSGCQVGMCDPDNGLGWAYLTNYANVLFGFTDDKRYRRLENAMYDCVNNINRENN